MAKDLAHWWANDLSQSASGDLLTVGETTKGQQRVLRRLMTNPQEYLWHGDYGAGLPLYIGEPANLDLIEAVIRFQIAHEPQVAQDPPPQIITQPILGGVWVRIIYTDVDAGNPVTLEFDVTE